MFWRGPVVPPDCFINQACSSLDAVLLMLQGCPWWCSGHAVLGITLGCEFLQDMRSAYVFFLMISKSPIFYLFRLCGFEPFYDERGDQFMFRRILNCEYYFISPWWDEVSLNAKDLVSATKTNPTQCNTSVLTN